MDEGSFIAEAIRKNLNDDEDQSDECAGSDDARAPPNDWGDVSPSMGDETEPAPARGLSDMLVVFGRAALVLGVAVVGYDVFVSLLQTAPVVAAGYVMIALGFGAVRVGRRIGV